MCTPDASKDNNPSSNLSVFSRQTVDLHVAGGERGAQAAAVTGSAAVYLRAVNMQQIASDATT